MHIIKYIHVACAILTVISFAGRGVWMLQGSRLLHTRATRIVPHVIDAILLLTGLILVLNYYRDFYHFDWLVLKLSAIILYIIAGSIALKRGRTRRARITALLVSWILLAGIITLAVIRPAAVF